MEKRLEGKAAIVTGAGQTPGDTIGNGKAISLLFARAGASVLLVDNRLDSAQETKSLIDKEGGESQAFAADVTQAEDCRRIAERCASKGIRVNAIVPRVSCPELPTSAIEGAYDGSRAPAIRVVPHHAESPE